MKLIRPAQGRRVIQRTPDLGLTLRLRREQEPAGSCAPSGEPPPCEPRLEWWDDDEQAWTTEGLFRRLYVDYDRELDPVVGMHRLVVARVICCENPVWSVIWIPDDEGSQPDWIEAGEVLVVRDRRWYWGEEGDMGDGTLEVRVRCSGLEEELGPLSLRLEYESG